MMQSPAWSNETTPAVSVQTPVAPAAIANVTGLPVAPPVAAGAYVAAVPKTGLGAMEVKVTSCGAFVTMISCVTGAAAK